MEVAASSAANNLGELLDRVQVDRREITVTRWGRPVAKLVPIVESGKDGDRPRKLNRRAQDASDYFRDALTPLDAMARMAWLVFFLESLEERFGYQLEAAKLDFKTEGNRK